MTCVESLRARHAPHTPTSSAPSRLTSSHIGSTLQSFPQRGRSGCNPEVHCLDSVKAQTALPGNDQVTLSQVFILSSQHGTTSAEIYYKDLECAVGVPSVCTSLAQPQIAYLAALLALAAGQPSGTSAVIGNAQITGNATMF
jgi:hypothetical protein